MAIVTGKPHIVRVSAGGDNATIAILHLVLVESRILGTGANCTGLWFRERWFKPDIAPPNIGEWFGNSDSLRFWGCENIVDCGELLGDYGTGLRLPGEKSLLPLVIGDLVLGLQLGEGLYHPVDEGLVLSLHNSIGQLPPLHNCARHQSRDCA